VGVERSGLPAGVYSGEITVLSSANSLSVRVLMSVGGDAADADVGTLYVLLLDVDSGDTVAQDVVTSEGGQYRFTLRDVPAGNYQLAAGSDADNDQYICDAGEACGAWLTLDQPKTLQIDGDREGLDFAAEYQVSIPDIPASAPGATAAAPAQRAFPPRRMPAE